MTAKARRATAVPTDRYQAAEAAVSEAGASATDRCQAADHRCQAAEEEAAGAVAKATKAEPASDLGQAADHRCQAEEDGRGLQASAPPWQPLLQPKACGCEEDAAWAADCQQVRAAAASDDRRQVADHRVLAVEG